MKSILKLLLATLAPTLIEKGLKLIDKIGAKKAV